MRWESKHFLDQTFETHFVNGVWIYVNELLTFTPIFSMKYVKKNLYNHEFPKSGMAKTAIFQTFPGQNVRFY